MVNELKFALKEEFYYGLPKKFCSYIGDDAILKCCDLNCNADNEVSFGVDECNKLVIKGPSGNFIIDRSYVKCFAVAKNTFGDYEFIVFEVQFKSLNVNGGVALIKAPCEEAKYMVESMESIAQSLCIPIVIYPDVASL
ncbi:MAG: hypothetical protein JXR97_10120 [Planctomycetes bacterium]|nr:hypothetical protein [Planctomycetota bacterium]